MASCDHIGFMQITRGAKSCYFGNQAEYTVRRYISTAILDLCKLTELPKVAVTAKFVLGPHKSTNKQTKLIGKNISRFMKCKID